jgi:ubiquinone/menaquinone biosynthesis C-methylase UbiE
MQSAANHFEGHSADSYEEAYFYSPGAYMQYLVDLVSKRLYLNTTTSDTNQRRRILDIGGGTGNFAKELVSNSQHTNTGGNK